MTLTVTDDDGAVDVFSETIVVEVPNVAPIASASFDCTLLVCDFDGVASSDVRWDDRVVCVGLR